MQTRKPRHRGDSGRLGAAVAVRTLVRNAEQEVTVSRLSEAAKAKNRETSLRAYYEYKAMGICWRCKKALAAPGRTYCELCRKKVKFRAEQLDPGNKRNNERGRLRRQRLKEAGLCTDCGKRPMEGGLVRCSKCAKKRAE